MPTTRSPLRYPGGKTQLSKYVKYLLKLNNVSDTYIEPFAGGFGVGLDLLYSNAVRKVVINDLDPSIFAIWYAILNNPIQFINLIKNTSVDIYEWNRQKKIHEQTKQNPKSLDNAFSSFFLNRTNVSGIINGGPIGGKEQTGNYKLNCRYNKKVLINKIAKIASYKNRIVLTNLDANQFIVEEIPKYPKNNTFIFFDPPYYSQGKNLYLSFVDKDKHGKLAQNIINLKKYNWITTYDIEEEILKLYQGKVKSYTYSLNYSVNKKRKAKEFIFANNNTKIKSFDRVKLEEISNTIIPKK